MEGGKRMSATDVVSIISIVVGVLAAGLATASVRRHSRQNKGGDEPTTLEFEFKDDHGRPWRRSVTTTVSEAFRLLGQIDSAPPVVHRRPHIGAHGRVSAGR
jgi:hypothetical protein